MKLSFKRITSSGSFIPEIDGLRFIAIASVVLFHLSGFITGNDANQYVDTLDYSFLKHLLSHGHLGVPLFLTSYIKSRKHSNSGRVPEKSGTTLL
jgi:peptidoglycan/LPS O-acetylase OafA/YrhL